MCIIKRIITIFINFLAKRPVTVAVIAAVTYMVVTCCSVDMDISRIEVWDSAYRTVWLKLPSALSFYWESDDFNWIAFAVCGIAGFAASHLVREWMDKK